MKRFLFVAFVLATALSGSLFAQDAGSEKWRLGLGGDGTSSALTLAPDGTLYVARYNNSGGGALWSLNTGANPPTTNWILNLANVDGPVDTPAVGIDGTVYLATDLDTFSAVNPATGSILWSFYDPQQFGQEIHGSPAIGIDGTVYIATAYNVYALTNVATATNANPKWTFSLPTFGPPQFPNSTPAVGADGTIYVTAASLNVYAIDPVSGGNKWVTPDLDFSTNLPANEGFSSPVVGPDGTVYFGADYYFVAVDPVSGTNKWVFQGRANDAFLHSPVIGTDGTIYAEAYGPTNRLFAFAPNGSVKWTNAVGVIQSISLNPADNPASCAIAANGQIYLSGIDGQLYSLSATGTTNWTYTAPDGSALNAPVIGPDGTIYTEAYDSGKRDVYAVNGQAPVGCTYWPEFQRNARRTGAVSLASLRSPQKVGGVFQATILGVTNSPVCLCASTDFQTWTNLLQTTITGGATNVADVQSTNLQKRFYRAMPQ